MTHRFDRRYRLTTDAATDSHPLMVPLVMQLPCIWHAADVGSPCWTLPTGRPAVCGSRITAALFRVPEPVATR